MTSTKRLFPRLGILISMVATSLAGCTSVSDHGNGTCQSLGATTDTQITLLFGLSRPNGTAITQAEWDAFLRTTVTPRFPNGLTVLEGAGQWRDRVNGRITSEPSRVIWIATQQSSDLHSRIEEIRRQYRQQFAQQSVGLTIVSGCDSF